MRIIIGKISLVYAILTMASVLNFGLLPDFIVDYLISFFNENNAKILMYYYNWYYFRLYWITFI
ncbi:transcriptional regulator [Bacillus cereus]|nr:transcriptional regulator [Bacillus cereus]